MLHKNLIKILLVGFVFALSSASIQASNDHNNDKGFEKLMKKLEHKKNVLAFDDAEIIFEQNATDGDVEVVIFAKLEEADAGMQQFWLYGPNGKVVYEFSAPKKKNKNIGGREIVIESPEPADTSIVFDAYPEGTYTFVAKSFDREWFLSEAELSHVLPDVTITFPMEDMHVPISMFNVTWTAVTSPSEKFIVELVNEGSDLEEELLVDIPADQYSFHVPEEWMVPDSEYQVVVSIVNEHGNKTSRELNVIATP